MEARPSLGRFRLRSRIGTGGMGEVYLATAPGPAGVEKLVAIKLIRGLQEQEPGLLEMFIEEAKVSFLLSHPNIVQTHEIGQIDGHYFLVMEYVDGITLGLLMRHFREKLRQPMPTPFAVYIAAQVARGLDHAHSFNDPGGRPLGIVHRDVSPSNVLLSRDGQVKVSDFGVAISALREFQSQAGEVKGKAAYMAPEQLIGRGVDGRADIFSLGVILYEMLSGRNPFAERRRDVSIPSRIRGQTMLPLSQAAGHLHRSVIEIVDRCLRLKPEGRFASCRELGRALETCLRDLGQPVSSYDFADFVEQARKAALATPSSTPHPFDRALGMVIQKVEAREGAVERYITVPPEAGGTELVPSSDRSVASTSSDRVGAGSGEPGPAMVSAGPEASDLAALARVSTQTDLSPPPQLVTGPSPYEVNARTAPTVPELKGPVPGVAPAAPPDRPVETASEQRSATMIGRLGSGQRWILLLASIVIVAGGLLLVFKPRTPAPSATPVRTQPRPPTRDSGAGSARPPDARERDRPVQRGPRVRPAARRRPVSARPGAARPGSTRTKQKGSGLLSVNADPWANVFVDGVFVQSTPLLRHRLPAGSHRVLLVNPPSGHRAERRVTIEPDGHAELVVELRK